MAEFCFECYTKYFDKNAKVEKLIMNKELDLCEGCGEYKSTVVRVRKISNFRVFKSWLKKEL